MHSFSPFYVKTEKHFIYLTCLCISFCWKNVSNGWFYIQEVNKIILCKYKVWTANLKVELNARTSIILVIQWTFHFHFVGRYIYFGKINITVSLEYVSFHLYSWLYIYIYIYTYIHRYVCVYERERESSEIGLR